MRDLSRTAAMATFTLCALGSVAIGLLTHGTSIFNPHLTAFQFTAGGVLCGALITAKKGKGIGTMFLVGLMSVPMVFAVTGADTGTLFLRDVTWVAGLTFAVWLGLANDRIFPRLALGKFILWGTIFGGLHWCMFAVLSRAAGAPLAANLAVVPARMGALIGSGLGLGYEMSELVRGQWTNR